METALANFKFSLKSFHGRGTSYCSSYRFAARLDLAFAHCPFLGPAFGRAPGPQAKALFNIKLGHNARREDASPWAVPPVVPRPLGSLPPG